tara:strand:+ start:41 stop:292 length:252 start_codon:yes stop_codon:yes gene_type:complete
MDTIYLNDYLDNKIIKENSFRKKIDQTNWEKYSGKKVLIKGCADAPIPTWAYMIITGKLTKYAEGIYFGEPCSAIKIYKKIND